MVHPCDPLKRYASIDRHRDFHTICMVDDAGFEDTSVSSILRQAFRVEEKPS